MNKGFTLIEILIVLAILSILIIFTATKLLSKDQSRASKSSVIAAVEQINLDSFFYLDENGKFEGFCPEYDKDSKSHKGGGSDILKKLGDQHGDSFKCNDGKSYWVILAPVENLFWCTDNTIIRNKSNSRDPANLKFKSDSDFFKNETQKCP